jgi:CheY-like chemotaxis protein
VQRLGLVLNHPIHVRSRPGRGSVFSVEAPTGSRSAPPIFEPLGSAPPRVRTLAGLEVVAIDNEPRVLDGMRQLLERWGCVVTTAPGVQSALQGLTHAADVVVADYHLDDGDGLEAIAAIREKLGRQIPAILATADRSPEVRDAARAVEVEILHKPVKPAPLRALLSRCLALNAAAE